MRKRRRKDSFLRNANLELRRFEDFKLYALLLENGTSSHDIVDIMRLPEDPETYFACVLHRHSTLAEHLPVRQLNRYIVDKFEFFKDIRNNILGLLAYPLLLILLLCVFVAVFDGILIPNLLDTIRLWTGDASMILQARIMLRLTALFLFLLLSASGFVLVSYTKDPRRFYRLIFSRWPDSLFVQWISIAFTIHFTLLLKQGHSTKRILAVMKNLQNEPIICMIAADFAHLLEKGAELDDAVYALALQDRLLKMLVTGSHSGSCLEILHNYLMLHKPLFLRKIRKTAVTVQLGAYSLIGVTVVVLYRMLLAPMAVISQI